ncbi:MAG: acyl carrier protein [Planctomycetes bacterium]|nr:acyl carrier protein [Planctomycetota bacterium]
MNAENIWPKLTDIFRDMFEDSKLTIGPETMAKDIEDWDSLAHIQLLVAIEKAFEIRFNTGEVAGIANVGEMVELIARRTVDIS